MKERDFQRKFLTWVKNVHRGSAAFELKVSKKSYLSFDALREHQRDSLLAVKKGKLVYKISDDSRGFKPFDVFTLQQAEAWVVVYFEDRRSTFYIIDIEDWVREAEHSGRKSLTETRAEAIGKRVKLGTI